MNHDEISRDQGSKGARSASAKAARVAGQVGAVLTVAIGLGFAGAAGCGATPESGPPAEESRTAEIAQAAGSPICVKITRSGPQTAQDTSINVESPSTNYGTSGFVFSGASAGGQPSRFSGLFRFDLSSIPANATVVSAKVTLNHTKNGPATPKVHVIQSLWGETTVTFNSFMGAFDPQHFATLNLSSANVVFNAVPQVQAWVSHAVPNRGFLIEQNGSPFQTKYKSEEYAVVSQRPTLDVCYTVSCPPDRGDCNNDPSDGCETELIYQARCGACGHICEAPHAGMDCDSLKCVISGCEYNYADCDGDAENGCETDVSLTPGSNNCGACGVSCPACGGLLGLGCPAGLTCQDAPDDGCDPANGGSDCAGLCLPPPNVEVCDYSCNGFGGFTCPGGLLCVDNPNNNGCQNDCPGLCVAPAKCGGFLGTPCPGPLDTCVDIPTDGCDPMNGGSDCLGLCFGIFDPVPTYCGGSAHVPCPGGFACQDVPCDGCFPGNGDTNCIGTCVPAP